MRVHMFMTFVLTMAALVTSFPSWHSRFSPGLSRQSLKMTSVPGGAVEEPKNVSSQSGLTGLVGLSSDDEFYARKLNFAIDLQGFTLPGLMWAAATADAEALKITTEQYMENIKSNRDEFFKGDLFDCKDLMENLREALDTNGTFTLLLGGKHVGKSKVLETLAKEYNDAAQGLLVLVVDMRKTDLTAGIVEAVGKLNQETKWKGLEGDFQDKLIEAAGELAVLAMGDRGKTVKIVSKLFKTEELTAVEAIASFVDAAKKMGRVPCLFVDEANRAFELVGAAAPEKKKRVQDILAMLTALAKQDKVLNVLLASSEYAYPYRLKKDVDFNVANIGRTIFAGEVPPASMRELLVKKWGLGLGLSDLCLAAYGGHIHYTAMALSELSLRKQDFAADYVVPASVYDGIVECLEEETKHPGMTDLLCELAVSGFAAIDKTSDPRAEMMVKKNVAGVVVKGSLVVGLPPEVWGCGAHCGLVPASQEVRLMIGEVLTRKAAREARSLALDRRRS
ncbi:hypothetical protein B484DRAFT_457106 [Ochromonadaceae sp. CCMP2298]|nr:hypothetical protein B484DRAFT_457106 [Ochromonadaceae sp. CCMP2298]